MFPNLNAEQARYGDSNETVAAFLGVTRVCYEGKKKRGTFSITEANKLCDKYGCDYAYLFSQKPIQPTA